MIGIISCDTNIETEATVYSSPIMKHQYPRISGEYMHSTIVIPCNDGRFITIIESVDSIGMVQILHIRTCIIHYKYPKYLKTGNFMKFLSVKIRISSKLSI